MKLLMVAIVGIGLLVPSLLSLNNPGPTVTSLHGFEEPLVALGGTPKDETDADLISAINAFKSRTSYEDVSALTTYLQSHPNSPWKFSLLANLGIIYRETGHFSRAIDVWEEAWGLAKTEQKDIKILCLANRVLADLASLLSSLGRTQRLDSLLAEAKGRPIYGSAMVQLNTANENLWTMKDRPGKSFKCGPYALESIRTFTNEKDSHSDLIRKAQSGSKGFSLTQVRDLSVKLKMNYQMAKREAGADFIVPSVAHWKSGHYAALLQKQGNSFLTKDPTFGQTLLVTSQALEDETSGYYLVPSGSLPKGWQAVSDAEGNTVWGRGVAGGQVPTDTKPMDKKCKDCPPSKGMADYNIFLMLVSLSIQDNPVGYTPLVGPDMEFRITYNQLEYSQPALGSSFTGDFNFGPLWNCNWLSYVVPPTSTGGTAKVYVRGGGQETYPATGSHTTDSGGYLNYYAAQVQGQVTLWLSPDGTKYERRMPDGSKEVFSVIDGSGYYLLKQVVDPQGNHIDFNYDGSHRLLTVIDATSQITSLTYGLSGDSSKVTQITDPYGRTAHFKYTNSNPSNPSSGIWQLTSIQDVVGITSTFNYYSDPSTHIASSAITSMVTPYGTTTFNASVSHFNGAIPLTRSLSVTEPDGSQVYVESDLDLDLVGYSNPYPYSDNDPYYPTGTGINIYNAELRWGNTFYWDKKAMHDAPGDYTKAHIYHWLVDYTMSPESASGVLDCEKPALESRIWYTYPGSYWYLGSSDLPTSIARVTDTVGTGTTQNWRYQYSDTHNPAALTAVIDPLGRQTNYTYDATAGIDLIKVTQNISGGGTSTLSTLAYTSTPHCPTAITDAAGQTTNYTYNAQGQVTSVTPPVRSGHSAEMTTYNYTSNFLTSIVGPMAGATMTFTPESMNRVRTVADAEAYTRTYSYDNLDRVTQITYPDSTTETFSYVNPTTSLVDLDLHASTDRLGRSTSRTYDSTRHMTSITDPLNRTTQYGWCSCGSMTSLTDPKLNVTYFNRDVEARLTSKVYPGGTQPPANPDYTYDTVGRVATFTDKRKDVTTYGYNLDNTLATKSYTLGTGSAAILPANVSYSYDTYYPRLTSAGGVSYSYVPVGSLGANKVLTVTNTLTGGTGTGIVTYAYDEWGRKVGRNIDSANNETTTFDSLGEVTNVTNLLGSFNYTYYDPTHPTGRVAQITYPNGQKTQYSYFNSYGSFTSTGDENLQQIKNFRLSGSNLSEHDYTVDAMGKVLTWKTQVLTGAPLLWTLGYDAADQLTSATRTNTTLPGTAPSVTQDTYGYDSAGNATSVQTTGITRSPSYNALNQLTSSTPSGTQTVLMTGALNGSASVTVNGSAAPVYTGNVFAGAVSLSAGSTSTVTVTAQDATGNKQTNHYQVIVPSQSSYSPTFDADGNETSNGAGQSYTWDVENRLIKITQGSSTYLFGYDALGQRISEKDNGSLTTQWVWDGGRVVDQRDGSNTTSKRYYALGQQISGASYYMTFDHLGSAREVMNSGGSVTGLVDYDPWGRVTLVTGTASHMEYAGYLAHTSSGLYLTKYRVYDPNVGKWLSRDPIGEGWDATLYSYVYNDPINMIDPLGLYGTATGGAKIAARANAAQAAAAALAATQAANHAPLPPPPLPASASQVAFDLLDSFSLQNMVGNPGRSALELGLGKPGEAGLIYLATKSKCPPVAGAGAFAGRALPLLGGGLMIGATIYDAANPPPPPPPDPHPAPGIPWPSFNDILNGINAAGQGH